MTYHARDGRLLPDRPERVERRTDRWRGTAAARADVAILLRAGQIGFKLDARIGIARGVEGAGVLEWRWVRCRAIRPVSDIRAAFEVEIAVLIVVIQAAGNRPGDCLGDAVNRDWARASREAVGVRLLAESTAWAGEVALCGAVGAATGRAWSFAGTSRLECAVAGLVALWVAECLATEVI